MFLSSFTGQSPCLVIHIPCTPCTHLIKLWSNSQLPIGPIQSFQQHHHLNNFHAHYILCAEIPLENTWLCHFGQYISIDLSLLMIRVYYYKDQSIFCKVTMILHNLMLERRRAKQKGCSVHQILSLFLLKISFFSTQWTCTPIWKTNWAISHAVYLIQTKLVQLRNISCTSALIINSN